MTKDTERGVQFPVAEGRRSSTHFGRTVVAGALKPVDPVGAQAALRATNWRSGYRPHFRQLVLAGMDSPNDAVELARAGLSSAYEQMQWCGDEGVTSVLDAARLQPDEPLQSQTVTGSSEPLGRLVVPYRGQRLEGDALRRQICKWVEDGIAEPTLSQVIDTVIEHPQWLQLPGKTAVIVGAGSAMGPLRAFLRWGAHVAATDLPGAQRWEPLLRLAKDSAGSLTVAARSGAEPLEQRAGADVLTQLPALTQWASSFGEGTVVGNYTYADGARGVRVAMAADALGQVVAQRVPHTAYAYLATPTDVFAVPEDAVTASTAAYEQASAMRVVRYAVKGLSGGRLLQRNYTPGSYPGLNDSVIEQQGPGYLLSKRLGRWRTTVQRAEGRQVSFTIAPPTRTQSVLKNRALAAAYAGAHRFGIEVFEPSTAATLMAAITVYHLYADPELPPHVWKQEAFSAVHGGLWRTAYHPSSSLSLAALLGLANRR